MTTLTIEEINQIKIDLETFQAERVTLITQMDSLSVSLGIVNDKINKLIAIKSYYGIVDEDV